MNSATASTRQTCASRIIDSTARGGSLAQPPQFLFRARAKRRELVLGVRPRSRRAAGAADRNRGLAATANPANQDARGAEEAETRRHDGRHPDGRIEAPR